MGSWSASCTFCITGTRCLRDRICYLQDLCTLELSAAKAGARVDRGVYARAKQTVRSAYWQTHETNHTAMKLYDAVADKSGFVVYRKQV